MADQVTLQTDIGSIPQNALSILGTAQPLLRALSADNINALAVLQAQSIGDCFHSNGDWAAKLPDLLARTSSARLERLSAWIGWQKGDTASYMKHSSGGRTVSLICLALGNLYPKERCGMILHGLSCRIIAQDQRNASISQLGDLNACLADKLSCVGFRNLFALQLTRIRQCLFETNCEMPTDLAHIPTEETMQDFLVELHKALQTENLTLYFYGSKGSGPLLALVMCLCPEDVIVEVQGELIHRGSRSSVVFSIREQEGSSFHIESKLRTHSEDFRHRYVQVDDLTNSLSLRFEWFGWLSSCLEIALANVGAIMQGDIQQALADLIATAALSLRGDMFYHSYSSSRNPRLPKDGMTTLLGPEHNLKVSKTLKTILTEPSNRNSMDLMSSYNQLKAVVVSTIPKTSCTCGFCSTMEQWNTKNHFKPQTPKGKAWRSCRLARFWALLGDIVEWGYFSPLVKVVNNSAINHVGHSRGPDPGNGRPIANIIWGVAHSAPYNNVYHYVGAEYIHNKLLSIVAPWTRPLYLDGQENRPLICRSSGHATIFPVTLQYPRIAYPWEIEYFLVDGKLRDGPNCYSAVICAMTQKGEVKELERKKALMSLPSTKSQIVPSSLGEHSLFIMTLKPEIIEKMQVLILRSTIQYSTHSFQVNFLDIHLGLLSLTPADACEHSLQSPLEAESTDGVITTSVATPNPGIRSIIAITLTHWNTESQFLCCSSGISGLYQGECCLTCAVEQARKEHFTLIIGGNC